MIRIGERRAEAGDVVDALVECHGRIRDVTAIAARLGAAEGASEVEVREAAARVRRYFSESLPRHVADEEDSLEPRLRGRDPGLDAALDRMHREHRAHDPLVVRLVAACAEVEADPARLAALQPEIAAVTAELAAELAGHLASEEEQVFPALRRILSEEERAAIRAEMRARRPAGA
jgi:iron-sulfur cluster repair protein YtfE (RIC family)